MPRDCGVRQGAGAGGLNAPGFRKALLAWFARGHRDLPWRRTLEPYRIWVSEIMLQQTRAAAAIPYYEAFLAKFPTVEQLARAPESQVLAAWAGLGYYSRARNLHKAAAAIAEQGCFPTEFAAIRALPGVGPYTAAAVASIAFGLPHAVLDGNVVRVLARLTAEGGDVAAGVTRRRLQEAADRLLDVKRPGDFNQAMMELGATICLPRDPLCLLCPAAAYCEARLQGLAGQLPVKTAKAAPRDEHLELAIVTKGEEVLMRQRAAGSARMAGFWEIPDVRELGDFAGMHKLGEFRHGIVNQRYRVTVFQGSASRGAGMEWILPGGPAGAPAAVPITTMSRKALRMLENR